MSLDSVLCERIDCVFNVCLEKDRCCGSEYPTEPYIINMSAMCGIQPELDKSGRCTQFIKIIDSFKPLLAWMGKVYTNNRYNQINLTHSRCWNCARYGKNDEVIDSSLLWCPSCYKAGKH